MCCPCEPPGAPPRDRQPLTALAWLPGEVQTLSVPALQAGSLQTSHSLGLGGAVFPGALLSELHLLGAAFARGPAGRISLLGWGDVNPWCFQVE